MESERDSPKAVVYLSFSLSHSLTLSHWLTSCMLLLVPLCRLSYSQKKRERGRKVPLCAAYRSTYSTGIGSGICQILVGSGTNRGRLVCAHFAIES